MAVSSVILAQGNVFCLAKYPFVDGENKRSAHGLTAATGVREKPQDWSERCRS